MKIALLPPPNVDLMLFKKDASFLRNSHKKEQQCLVFLIHPQKVHSWSFSRNFEVMSQNNMWLDILFQYKYILEGRKIASHTYKTGP